MTRSDLPTTSLSGPDRVALSTGASVGLVGATALAAGALLALLPRLAGWVLALPWVPFQGPLRLARELDAHVAWWVLALAGLVVGTVVGLGLVDETVVVTVDEREIVVRKGRQRARYARAQVHRVVVDGRRLSLRDERDVDLLDEKIDGEPADLVAALRRHGWPSLR